MFNHIKLIHLKHIKTYDRPKLLAHCWDKRNKTEIKDICGLVPIWEHLNNLFNFISVESHFKKKIKNPILIWHSKKAKYAPGGWIFSLLRTYLLKTMRPLGAWQYSIFIWWQLPRLITIFHIAFGFSFTALLTFSHIPSRTCQKFQTWFLITTHAMLKWKNSCVHAVLTGIHFILHLYHKWCPKMMSSHQG